MSKSQFMVLLDPIMEDRVLALRVVMGISGAEVVRQALNDAGLNALEEAHRERLQRLFFLAELTTSRDWREWVRKNVKGAATVHTLEVYEALQREKSPPRAA